MPREVLPFIVEDGSGYPDATSYVSVLEADTYMDRILDAYKSAWTDSDEFQKQQMLVWGTQLFDEYVYFPNTTQGYRNIRTYRQQALQFPRSGLMDRDGYTIDYRSVPTFVKQATIQLGFELRKSDRVVEPVRGIVSASVGPLSITFDQNYSHQSRVIPRSVASIVAPYGGVIRGQPGIKSIPLYRA